MRQFLQLLLLSIFFFSACHKKDKAPPATPEMSFKKDGVKEDLPPYYSAIQPNSSWPTLMTDFMVVGRSNDFKTTFAITLQVSGSVKTGAYDTNTSGCYVIADYFKNQGDPDERDYAIDNADNKPPCYFKVTITSITDDRIAGTFSGNYLYDRSYNEFITITEGSFVAKRHN